MNLIDKTLAPSLKGTQGCDKSHCNSRNDAVVESRPFVIARQQSERSNP
ncbi:hypothetical protein [Helicobacter sp. MIT 05-5294]|nr:hypothetical protein [Helicobacter sp. MIT 05-5294]